MAEGLIGRKIGCTQLFREGGGIIPATVILAGPCRVTGQRLADKHGYNAIQIGFGIKKESRIRKPERGQAQASGGQVFKEQKEFRVPDPAGFFLGQDLTVSIFSPGEKVKVAGKSKGKGFQGVIKRHGHHGGPESHGSMFNRAPGSIGQGSAYPSRVVKGRALPGRMGGSRVTVKNLEVVQVRPEENVLVVKGSVPGPRDGIVWIEKLGQKS